MKIVVIGGGFAGLAAAIALQERRHSVVLLERRGVLGGRATSFRDAVTGEDVDNGTHLMIGAYTATLDLVARAGASDLLLEQDGLAIDYVDDRGLSALRCPSVIAPLHLVAGILGMRLAWRARWAALRLGWAVRFGRPPVGLTLAEYFRQTGQGPAVRKLLWDPLATAVLNETPERAAAILFYNVFREAFLTTARASRLVFLRRGWSALHDRLARYFEGRGGVLYRRAVAEAVEIEDGRAAAVRLLRRAETREEIRRGKASRQQRLAADAIVIATPWSAVASLVPEEHRGRAPFEALARFEGSPIVSVDLWVDRPVVDRIFLGLRDSEMEWVFDKGRLFGRGGLPQHLSFIVSAAYRSAPRPNAELVAVALAALRRYFPAMRETTVVRSLVLREPDATFSCGPAVEVQRPGPETPIRGLYLAGDWTDTGLPATIEGAVRSGFRAARSVEAGSAPP